MGRPTKLTKKVHESIIESVRNGNYVETAVAAAGIAKQTFYNWKARGEEGGRSNKPYVDFLDALTCAEAEAEQRAVKALGDAFTDDWRAAAEYLRRRHPDRWSTQDRIQHSGEIDQRVTIEVPDTEEFKDQLDEVYARLAIGRATKGNGNGHP